MNLLSGSIIMIYWTIIDTILLIQKTLSGNHIDFMHISSNYWWVRLVHIFWIVILK